MDIEKLIEQLNARGLSNGSSLGYHCGLYDEAAAALTALTALRPVSRERVERMRGEWRSIHGLSEYYCARCGEEFEIHAYDKEKYRFCPHCMAPMTDEAVQMVMERINKMEGMKNESC